MKSEMARLKESHPNITYQDWYVLRVLVRRHPVLLADNDDLKLTGSRWRPRTRAQPRRTLKTILELRLSAERQWRSPNAAPSNPLSPCNG